MLDLVVIDGKARGIVVRDLITGSLESYVADAVIIASGGYSNVFYLSTNAATCSVSAAWKAYKKGALFANPCYTQIHPTCIPVSGDHQSKLTLMSESLRNDGRVWIPRNPGDKRDPSSIPEADRYYYLEERYPGVRQPGAQGCRFAETPRSSATQARGSERRGWRCISTCAIPSNGRALT